MPEPASGTADGSVAAFRARFAALDAVLAAGAPSDVLDRETRKADIIALFRDVDRTLGELAAVKDEIRRLVETWKTQPVAPALAAHRDARPAADAAVPPSPTVTTRADHLGASTFVAKGWSLISTGEFAAAEEALTRALAHSPDDAEAATLLGWAQMGQGKYDDALLHLQRVLLHDPSHALARVNVGYVCLRKGIYGEAIEHLAKAVRGETDRKATLYGTYYLGLVYQRREMYDDAVGFFREALALGPNLLEAHFETGRSLWLAGDRSGALFAWREGAAASKFNPWARRCDEVRRTVEAGGEPPPLD